MILIDIAAYYSNRHFRSRFRHIFFADHDADLQSKLTSDLHPISRPSKDQTFIVLSSLFRSPSFFSFFFFFFTLCVLPSVFFHSFSWQLVIGLVCGAVVLAPFTVFIYELVISCNFQF